jgi:Family of unknown function (DUF6262)
VSRGNPDNLRAAAQRKSQATTKRGETALRTMIKNGQPITFRGVARAARCSIDFLYGNVGLRERIEHLRSQQQANPAPAPSNGSSADSKVSRALTAQLAELRRRHREELDELRTALAAAHGENLEPRRRLGPRHS